MWTELSGRLLGWFLKRKARSMSKEMLMDVLRTILKSFGGAAVAWGFTGDEWSTVVGGICIVAGLVWSWFSTKTLEAKSE
jgi:hypothetical protein